MATKEDLDITICPICIKTYTTPKYLPCLHTFCEYCLSHWISRQVRQGGNKTSFECPVCRTKTMPPLGNESNSAEWASRFPINHLMVSLIDQILISKKSKFCDSCNENNEHRNARQWCVQCSEAYCELCLKVHKSMKISKKHKTFPLQDVLKDLKQISSNEVCSEHEDEKIQLFCVDHDEPCCTLCATVSHRKCDKVINLLKVADGIRDSEKFEKLLRQLSTSHDSIEQTEKAITENIKDLDKKKSNIESQSQQLTKTVIDHIQALHTKYQTKLDTIYKAANQTLIEKKDMCKLKRKMVNNSKDLLQKATQNASESQLFLQMKRTEIKQKESQEFVMNELSKVMCKKIEHEFEKDLLSLMTSITSFGTLKTVESKAPGATMKISTPKPCSYEVEERKRWGCDYSAVNTVEMGGCFAGDKNSVVILDPENGRLLLYNSNGTLSKEFTISDNGTSYGVVQFLGVYIVSFPDRNQICVFGESLHTDEFQVLSRVEKMCYGLTIFSAANHEIIAACATELTVYKMDVFATLSFVRSYQVDGKNVRHVAVDEKRGRIYYTDIIECTIICIDGRSEMQVFKYSDHENLKYPTGISLDREGNIFVVGCLSKNVLVINARGQLIRQVLSLEDRLYHPHEICFQADGQIFLLTNDIDVIIYRIKTE